MNISIFGLGYVGAVTAGCLAQKGHRVVGVDVHPQKVASCNRGVPPIMEPELDGLMALAYARGLLSATLIPDEAIASTEVSIVCVGTPSGPAGELDLTFVRGVVREIGGAVRRKGQPHALILRSTMLPGSTASLVDEFLADLTRTGQLEVIYHPEFMREGTAVADFESPPLAVVGTGEGARPPATLMSPLFGETATVVTWPTAEMVKYACNAFHATKVVFANEIGRLGKAMGVDARAVMALLCQDTTLNLSSAYLTPGNPFGGSCLPKDVRALTDYSRKRGLVLPLVEGLVPSNDRHLQSLMALIVASGQSEVVIVGLAFKLATDDLRESAMVEVARTLLGRGYAVRLYDPALNLSALVGSNKRLIDSKMPHLASLLHEDLAAALGTRGVVVLAQRCVAIEALKRFITPAHHVIDVNGWPEARALPASYEGLCW